MAKRERLELSQHQNIETGRDWNGRYFIGYSSGSSRLFRDRKVLVRWLNVPKSIPMRAVLDSWLDDLEAADQERQEKKTVVSGTTAPALSQEQLAAGFGPECHEEQDPVANTKMVI